MLTLLTACATFERPEKETPSVSAGVPAWENDQTGTRTVQVAAPDETVPGKFTVSEPENAEPASEQHRETLLARAESTLPADEIGYYMDVQEARLIQLLRDTDIEAERRDSRFELVLDDAFATDSTSLLESARQRLAPVARVLDEYDRTRVSIFGYTDDVGEADYNQQLSMRRASAVARFLEEHGVDAGRMFVVGFGEDRPIADNGTAAGRARNRRVEIIVETLARPPATQEAEMPAKSG